MATLIEVRGVSKSFPGVKALQNVSMRVEKGEVLALIGENGAGKSTLMKILGGIYTPDEGQIFLDGKPAHLGSVTAAEAAGIALIHQELNQCEHLDVAGNVFLGREKTTFLGFLDSRMYQEARQLTLRLGLDVSPRTRVSELTVGQQQLVEIARALATKSRLLILDEPTSSLTTRETEKLFQVLRQLREEGMSMVYISHRLREIEEIADRVTVLRDGKNAGELAKHEIHHDAMVRLMVGRDMQQFYERQRPTGLHRLPPVLEVRDLRWSPRQKHPLSFKLFAGEVVGMAGLIGSGRTELAETIFGARKKFEGEIFVDGQHVNVRRPAQAISAGIFLIPEDRRLHGLVLSDSVQGNVSLASLEAISVAGMIKPGAEKPRVAAITQKLQVKTPHLRQKVGLLSGGNQQKVVLSKWLLRSGRVIIFDEPTRGIDVGAKKEIYALMDELARDGLAILMISSDLEEVLGISDRVLVMHESRLAGEVRGDRINEVNIMNLATGKDA